MILNIIEIFKYIMENFSRNVNRGNKKISEYFIVCNLKIIVDSRER